MSLLLLRRKRRRNQPSSGAWPPPAPSPPLPSHPAEGGKRSCPSHPPNEGQGPGEKEERGGRGAATIGAWRERERGEKWGCPFMDREKGVYTAIQTKQPFFLFFIVQPSLFKKPFFSWPTSVSTKYKADADRYAPQSPHFCPLNCLFSSSLTLRSKVGLSRNNLTDQGWRDKGCLYSCCCCFCSHSEGH